jgi:hypothetical protein
MRKFGRPDLSVHGVPPQYRGAVIDLFERFIAFQAFGGVIAEGQEIRMKTLPKGKTCRHAGDVSDQAHGTAGFHEALMNRHGQPVRPPQRQEWKPAPESLDWQAGKVFKGAVRPIA